MRTIFFFLGGLLFPLFTLAQPLRILLPDDARAPDARAARILQHYLQQITGNPVPVIRPAQAPRRARLLLVGDQPGLERYGLQHPPALSADAFFLHGNDRALLLAGGGEMGAEYAAYALLERLGCRLYSPRDSFIPHAPRLRLPHIPPTLETPAFPYRELHYEPAFNEHWARWHRLKTRRDKTAEWGLFVHTFDRLCPAEKYFAEHPEFYAWNGAQRSPGQLCLSNDTVKQIIIESLRTEIAKKPDALYWSVSQNDNFDYCKCPRCTASDTRLGGPAGTLLAFVNDVAAAFPDKTISTLAYQYTRRAPAGIRPAPNVSICLCSIECNRGQDIEHGCADFARDVAEWAALTGNLMIWDYVVQFRDYVCPFPNWPTLQPNLQLFQRRGVRMLFEQGSGGDRSEFSDMRAYLLAKLMWNPAANADSILNDFGQGYYGAAWPHLRQYILELTDSLQTSSKQLIIYGTPLTYAHSFLTEEALSRYDDLLKAAEKAEPDGLEADRLMAVRLTWVHAFLEQIKIRDSHYTPCIKPGSALPGICYFPEITDLARLFPAACEKAGYRRMNENGYTPAAYAADLQNFMEEGRVMHHFMQRRMSTTNAPVVHINLAEAPTPPYARTDPGTLVDSRRGADDYHYNWLGFWGKDLDATIRLDAQWPDPELPEASKVSVQFLQDQQSWVFFPEKVVLEISPDGNTYQTVHTETIETKPDGQKRAYRVEAHFPKQKIRSVRVRAENRAQCPPWHPCTGNPAWIFVDEIVVE